MKKIIVSRANKSEGYLESIITRLKAHPDFTPLIFHPVPKGQTQTVFNIIYKRAEIFINNNPVIDAIIIPSDRVEHLPVAIAAFHKNIPIIQFYGGDISGSATFDDYNRYVYSIYASVVFCATEESTKRVRQLFDIIKKDPTHIYVSGMTHFDDVEIDESEVPQEPYTLVLYNPITKGKNPEERINKELEEITSLLENLDELILWIEPNDDPGRYLIIEVAKKLRNINHLGRMDRNKFLGLLKHCSRLISNSSAVFYEAKNLLSDEQIILIGERNKLREEVPISEGGSDKIIKILEAIDFDKI